VNARSPKPCLHCETLFSGPGEFCCAGCEAASVLIAEAGLQSWYERREVAGPRPESAPVLGLESIPCPPDAEGLAQATLRIEGLRCAACVWLVERILEDTDGVEEVQVSYASGHARLRFDPERLDLAQAMAPVQALGYRPRPLSASPQADRGLLLRLGVAAFSATNVMLLSVSLYLGWIDTIEGSLAALFRWTSLVLAAPVAIWAAEPFHTSAWASLKQRVLHMDLPISLAVTVLFTHGLWATWTGQDSYLDSLTMLVTLLLAGRLLEQRGRHQVAEAATALAAQTPSMVRRLVGAALETVPAQALAPGDVLELAAGEQVGADGRVVSGQGLVDSSLLTGESEPRPVGPGERLVAGSVLRDGAVQMEVTRVGGATLIGTMAAELRKAADKPARATAADRLAPWFTLATLSAAGLTLAGWTWASGLDSALEPVVAVLVVACPCALALARPLSAAAGLGAAARRGLLVRSPDELEALASVDRVVLDKTGTLTLGEPTVVEASDETLRLASGLERHSLHPIARAIVRETIARGIPLAASEQVRELPGLGMRGSVEGRQLELRGGGPGEVLLVDGHSVERILLADRARPDTLQALRGLAHLGLPVTMLTGDREQVAERVASELGLQHVVAGASPLDKATQAARGRTLFVGDGLNDGPALAASHAGVAMGGGVASSVLAAGSVLAHDSLVPLTAGLLAAREASAASHTSLRRALLYNLVAVLAAALGWVNPLVAALLMPLSSALVIARAASIESSVRRQLERL
jgi:Cu2+-exporting ATPase